MHYKCTLIPSLYLVNQNLRLNIEIADQIFNIRNSHQTLHVDWCLNLHSNVYNVLIDKNYLVWDMLTLIDCNWLCATSAHLTLLRLSDDSSLINRYWVSLVNSIFRISPSSKTQRLFKILLGPIIRHQLHQKARENCLRMF